MIRLNEKEACYVLQLSNEMLVKDINLLDE
jgi:hypothetical protein